MEFATNLEGNRITAEKNAEGSCPVCASRLVPKCGEQVVWHWAHWARADCDHWWDSEGPWHTEMKTLVEPVHREIVIGPHRADIFAGDTVIELQHSHLSIGDITERTEFYSADGRRMVWVFDGAGHVTVRDGVISSRADWGPFNVDLPELYIHLGGEALYRVVDVDSVQQRVVDSQRRSGKHRLAFAVPRAQVFANVLGIGSLSRLGLLELLTTRDATIALIQKKTDDAVAELERRTEELAALGPIIEEHATKVRKLRSELAAAEARSQSIVYKEEQLNQELHNVAEMKKLIDGNGDKVFHHIEKLKERAEVAEQERAGFEKQAASEARHCEQHREELEGLKDELSTARARLDSLQYDADLDTDRDYVGAYEEFG